MLREYSVQENYTKIVWHINHVNDVIDKGDIARPRSHTCDSKTHKTVTLHKTLFAKITNSCEIEWLESVDATDGLMWNRRISIANKMELCQLHIHLSNRHVFASVLFFQIKPL